MSNPTKYYFLAPTWHHHPKSGALQLGNVFLDLGAPEDPIHRGPPPPPPKETDFPPEPGSGVLTESWQTNYIFKAEEFRSGKLGIWTRFLTILGIKVDLAHEWNKGANQVFTVERLETTEFLPNDVYIRACLEADAVARLISRRRRSFFIVTGIKAFYGAKLTSSETTESKTTASTKLDLAVTGIAPVSVGPGGEAGTKTSNSIGWDAGSDFVFAYRVQKINISRRTKDATHNNVRRGALLDHDSRDSSLGDPMDFALAELHESDLSGKGYTIQETENHESLVLRDNIPE